jgi:hypothetical protein
MKTDSINNRVRAFTFVDLLVVLVTVVLFVGWFLPWLARPRGCVAVRINCISNLKQIGLAFRMWANDHGDKFPMSVSVITNGTMEFNETGDVFRHFQVLSNELNTPRVLVCSNDKERTRATNWTIRFSNKNVSYFVALDADETQPQTILSGDRNITGGVLTNGNIMLFTANSQAGWSKELHKHQGNVGLADGSAQQCTASGLRRQFQSITNVPIRLAIP